MSLFSAVTDKLYPVLISPGSHFSIFSLGAALCVSLGFLAHRQWKRRGHVRPKALWRAFFSNDLIWHRSTRADMLYFGLNIFVTGVFIGWGCIAVMDISQHVEDGLTRAFGARTAAMGPEWAMRAIVTVVAFLAYEFGYWFDHYLKHRIPFLWETHKTHHTAERLTPWTVWRVHPLDSLVFTNVVAGCVGVAVGVMGFAFGNRFQAFSLGGTNLFLVGFFFIFVHLQHSQVWLPLTGTLGKLFMSPAHHQIHHSIDPAHYNTNMGNALAVYDWLFGTLTIPEKASRRLAYGVEEPGVDPHSVTELIVSPFRNVAVALIPRIPASGRPATIEKPAQIIQ